MLRTRTIVAPRRRTVPFIYPSPNCYLLAVHTIYESNKDDLRKVFAAIRAGHDPAATIITCAASKEHVASQVAGGGFRRLTPSLERLWQGGLPEVTQWRRGLAQSLGFGDPILRNFLRPAVEWRPPQSETLVLMSP